MSHLPAFTIASNNYLAFARVFAESYQEHHPGAEVFVCIVDHPDPQIDYERLPFRVIFAGDLGIPRFQSFAFRYDILELNTAVKPFVMTHLRDRHGLERVLYLDPDILVMDHLGGLEEALASHPAVLTPHVTEPLDNAHDPAERKILMVGVYNLGFLGLRLDESTAAFLEWWQDRLYKYCLVDPHNGLFVDQSWMNLAPAYLDSALVLRDPIYNVAYWNLPHRHPRHDGESWCVDGRRIAFFHFSGLSLQDLDTVSRHQTRLDPGERPELRPLFEEYRDRVFAAGHPRLAALPYGYARFARSGVEIPPVARRTLQRVDPGGRRWTDPFDPDGDSFFSWLVEPLELPLGDLNRAVLAYWEERYDLVREFGEPCGPDLERYVNWLHSHRAIGQELLPLPFLQRVRARLETPAGLSFAPQVAPYDAGRIRAAEELLRALNLRRPGEAAGWLNDPVPGTREPRPVLTRAAMLLHAVREDVRELYPDPYGRDQAAFAYWFCDSAGELGLAPELSAPVRRSLPWRSRLGLALRAAKRRQGPGRRPDPPEQPAGEAAVAAGGEGFEGPAQASCGDPAGGGGGSPRRDPGEPARGVNLVASFAASSGPGRLGSATFEALGQAGIATSRVPLDQDLWGRTAHGRVHQVEGAPYPVTLLQVDPARTPHALGLLPVSAVAGNVRIGYWLWDLAHLPLYLAPLFGHVDEVWAPSRFCRDAFSSLADVPVRWVAPYVPAPGPSAHAAVELETGTFHLFAAVDAERVAERDQPLAAIEVIRRLRRREVAVELVIAVDHAAGDPGLVAALRREGRDLPVRVETDPSVPAVAWMAACDGFLSLHRAGGLAVSAITALHLGKPVVATAYGGVSDFLDESTGFPVGYRLKRLAAGVGEYPAGAVLAEPDLEHAVDEIVRLVGDPDDGERRGAAGRRKVDGLYGAAAAARRLGAELERVFGRL